MCLKTEAKSGSSLTTSKTTTTTTKICDGQQRPHRLFFVIIACIQNALVAGILFGWASIDRTMLVASRNDGGAGLSPNETATIFSYASSVSMISSIILGSILDKYGPRTCSLVGNAFIGCGCLLFATSTSFHGFAIAACLITFGGPGITASIVHIANLFTTNRFFIMTCLDGSISLSFAIFAIFDFIWEHIHPKMSFRVLFGSYIIVILLSSITSFWFWPDKPFEEQDERDDELETTVHSPDLSDHSSSLLLRDEQKDEKNENEEDETACSNRQNSCPSVNENGKNSYQEESIETTEDHFKRLERSMSLREKPFIEQLLSFRYLRLYLTFVIMSFMANFYVASITTELADIHYYDVTQQHELATTFTLLMSVGIIGSLTAGCIIDLFGLETCAVITILLGQCSSLISLFCNQNYTMMTIGFAFYSLFRQFLFPVFIGGLISRFGFKYFGVLSGIGFFTSGVVQIFMAHLIQLLKGNCNHTLTQEEGGQQQQLESQCDEGHWKEYHIIQILLLGSLFVVPYMDYQEKRRKLQRIRSERARPVLEPSRCESIDQSTYGAIQEHEHIL